MLLTIQQASWQKPKKVSFRELEKIFGFHYSHTLLFHDYEVEQYTKKKCSQAYKKNKISDYTLFLGKLHKKDLEYESSLDLSIRLIDHKIGYGLFTNQELKPWQVIGKYTGLLRFRNHLFRNINDYCFMYPRYWINFKPLTIDSQNHGNHTRFINHSDDPNCESLSVYHNGIFHIIFRTIKEVKKDEELTYDYGEIYWNNRKKWR